MKKLVFVFALAAMFAACSKNSEKTETIEEKITRLENDDSLKINKDKLVELTATYLVYVDSLPKTDNAPKYLYKAAYNTGVLGNYDQAIDLYERFLKQYKTHEKCPEVLWAMGATYENSLQEYGKAKECYLRLLEKYPNHELAPSAENAAKFVGREPTAEEIEELMKKAEGQFQDSVAMAQ